MYPMPSALPLCSLLISCNVLLSASSIADTSWQAQWIGHAQQPSADLSGASWFWSDELGIDPTRSAKPGNRFFRREIQLDPDAKLTSAIAIFTADNHFKLTVNGKHLGGGNDWQKPQTIDIADSLTNGSNTIIIHGTNDPDEGPLNAAGIIGKILIQQEGRAVQEIATDAQWQSAETASSTAWKPAKVIGILGIAPWGAIPSDAASAHANLWTCYRKKLTLDKKPTTAIARISGAYQIKLGNRQFQTS